MKIAIDIDDVLLQNTSAFINFVNREYRKNLKAENFTSRRVWEILSSTIQESNEIILRYYESNDFEK